MSISPNKIRLSVVLPTYNERENIAPLLSELLSLLKYYAVEIIVIDDNSKDQTAEIVKDMARRDSRIRLIRRIGRAGLASAIKEGLLASTGDIAAVMDSDGQHQPVALIQAIDLLQSKELDLVAGSRFLKGAAISGLSNKRTEGSTIANKLARISLARTYTHLTDYMSGFFVVKLESALPIICKVDVNGFKFLYELLAVSKGSLDVNEVPLNFKPRKSGISKLDISILWDFLISFLHTITLRILPRRAISFGIVGTSGVLVQLISTEILMRIANMSFQESIPISVVIAATSNYLVNNALTFRSNRLNGKGLLKGLLKFLLVASLPVLANVGLATTFYNVISANPFIAQMAGIIVVFIWNYAASSKFVWNSP